jgi:hypothetical protein
VSIKAKQGQRVQVDLGGLAVAGLSIGPGVLGIGEIIGLDPDNHSVTIKLDDLSVGAEKKDTIQAPIGNVQLLPPGA